VAGPRKAFVVGHPIGHSRSPLIHGFWLRQLAVQGSYERLDVPPAEFEAFVERFADRGFAGGNVTIPHKEQAFRRAQVLTERAERLRAVNTLWIEDGRVCGDNTDVLGFVAHLDQTLGDGWAREAGRGAAVIGAGGAARAVVAGLLDRGLDRIVVANRTLERAEDVTRLDPRRVRAVGLDKIGSVLPGSGLLVNTTSLGMAGQPPLEIDLRPLAEDAIVADIVYVPLETPLLRVARERGLRIVDGLGMLLHQAVPGFARWFGVTPQVTPELRALIAADIARASGSP
jgi:shikimate dehydrogenase